MNKRKLWRRALTLLLCALMVLPGASPLAAFAADGDTNVARGKSVTASSGFDESTVTDGSRSGGYWDSHDMTPASVTIDLAGYYKISRIHVFPYFGAPVRHYHYEIQLSADGFAFEKVAEKTTDEQETSAGKEFDIESLDKTARYVRVVMLLNSANPSQHLHEVEVYGHEDTDFVPPEPGGGEDPVDKNNIAFGKPTRSNGGGLTAAVVNGDESDFWTAKNFPDYVDIDLLKNYDITDLTVYTPQSSSYQYAIYTSLDGVNFTRQVWSELERGSAEGHNYRFEQPVTARVVRVNIVQNGAGASNSSALSEVRVHGNENTDVPVTPTREKMTFTTYDEWLESKNYSSTITEADTRAALEGLITRILGGSYVSWFDFAFAEGEDGEDYFTVETINGKTKITANNGVSAATGLNYYLKYYCNVEVSQETAQVTMPKEMPVLAAKEGRSTPLKVRYAYNYCTLSYTMPFFGYEDWQRELDYLMLSGVNVILDTTATEALWVSYLQKYGYTAYEALDFVCGYAYKAWWLMGNLEGYGGNVSDRWVLDTLEMARVNERYMIAMGAQPCLQAFVGTLPIEFGTKAASTLTGKGFADPGDYMTSTGNWSGFTRPYVINTTYDGYEDLASTFYETQKELYGDITDFYAGDFFHEISGNPPAAFNKAQMASKVLDYMIDFDPDARWILQAWWSNPLPEVLEGFGDRRNTNVLILDLAAASEGSPKYKNTTTWGGAEFGGTDWIFSILDNYGGRQGVHGTLQRMASAMASAKKNYPHMYGIGITPEGTQQNPIVYDLFWEQAWCDDAIQVSDWIDAYAARRYGGESENTRKAWQRFVGSNGIYATQTADGTGVNYGMNDNISFQANASVGAYYTMPYNEKKFAEGVRYLLADFDRFADCPNYVYDVVHFVRQMISGEAIHLFNDAKAAIAAGNAELFKEKAAAYVQAMKLIDEVSAYQQNSLFGEWVGKVDRWCDSSLTGEYDDYGRDMMKINAKMLVTVWASTPLWSYAYRQYNGLMADYYIPLWEQLIAAVTDALEEGNVTESKLRLNNSEWFKQAMTVVCDPDREYLTEAIPARGDEAGGKRSLLDVYRDALKINPTRGDINGDGKVDIKDATRLVSALTESDPTRDFFDLTDDNKLTSKDVARLLSILEG